MAIALYRRYRPETFADVIGQEHVTEPLMQALRTGRVNHAYLFSGPRGCGKTTSARILARCLNCEQGPTPTPCGTCDSCVALARGGSGSVDVIEIDAASHGGVDDARDLRERASYGPAQSRYKIYIIDEAHMVTPQGFNALLKIVEEPPEHVKFVFATTEPEKVIGTIRSRTHHYPFRLVPPAKLSAYMERLLEQEGVPAAPGVLSFVTRAGGGSVRDSLSVLDQLIAGSGPEGLTYDGAVSLLGFTDGELLDATVDALAAGDSAATFRQIDKVIESGHDPRRFVEDLLERLRDLIIVAAVQEGAAQVLRGVPEDQLERMRVQQAAFGPGALSRAADIVNTGLTEMTGATAPRMQLELICARILLPASSGEQGYAARLDRLERRLDVGGVPSASGGAAGPAGMPLSSPPGPPPVPASAPSGPMAGVGSGGTGPAAAGASAAGGGVSAPPRTVSDYSAPSRAAAGPAGHDAGPGEPQGPSHGSSRGAGGMGGSRSADIRHVVGAPDPGPIARADAARAEAGAPPVVPPAESVGGPSASQAGLGTGQADASPEAGTARPAGGGMDTDAIRRAWPNVLGRIFTMRRLTWTFVSQNAQVTAFDGQTLTLGIATAGLTQTFRAGNHAEVVRQALIDELGVDAIVNGVHVDDVAQQAPVAPPPGAVPPAGEADPHRATGGIGRDVGPGRDSGRDGGTGRDSGRDGGPGSDPGSSRQSWGDAGAGHDPGASPVPSGGALADAGLSAAASRSHYDNAGWGSVSGPAPDWATGPAPDAEAPVGSASTVSPAGETASAATGPGAASRQSPTRATGSPTAAAKRGAKAVRESIAQARTGAAAGPSGAEPRAAELTDDSAVSADDEDIEVSGDVGRAVVERVLGGRVIQELDD
ncbi:DNA polymerase III subunit gamma and tau [Intrasporangium mesophilum]